MIDTGAKGFVDEVHCVRLPPRFHYNTSGQCALLDPRNMQYGLEQRVGPQSTVKAAVLVQMYKYLGGIDVALLRRGDFNGDDTRVINRFSHHRRNKCTRLCQLCDRILYILRTDLDLTTTYSEYVQRNAMQAF